MAKLMSTKLIKYARDTESLILKSNILDSKNSARSFAMSVRHLIPVMEKTASLLPNTKCSAYDLAFDTSNYQVMTNISLSTRIGKSMNFIFKNTAFTNLENAIKTSESLTDQDMAIKARLRILIYAYSLLLVAYQASQNTIGYVNEQNLSRMLMSMEIFINDIATRTPSYAVDLTSLTQFRRLLAFNKNLRNDIK